MDTVTEPLPHHIQKATLTLARQYNLDDDWLNNNVIRYINQEMDLQPILIWSGKALQIYRPALQVLLTMKISSLREEDAMDTVRLIEETGINTAEKLQSLVKSVSGNDHLPVLVEEHIEDMLREHAYLLPTPDT